MTIPTTLSPNSRSSAVPGVYRGIDLDGQQSLQAVGVWAVFYSRNDPGCRAKGVSTFGEPVNNDLIHHLGKFSQFEDFNILEKTRVINRQEGQVGFMRNELDPGIDFIRLSIELNLNKSVVTHDMRICQDSVSFYDTPRAVSPLRATTIPRVVIVRAIADAKYFDDRISNIGISVS